MVRYFSIGRIMQSDSFVVRPRTDNMPWFRLRTQYRSGERPPIIDMPSYGRRFLGCFRLWPCIRFRIDKQTCCGTCLFRILADLRLISNIVEFTRHYIHYPNRCERLGLLPTPRGQDQQHPGAPRRVPSISICD